MVDDNDDSTTLPVSPSTDHTVDGYHTLATITITSSWHFNNKMMLALDIVRGKARRRGTTYCFYYFLDSVYC